MKNSQYAIQERQQSPDLSKQQLLMLAAGQSRDVLWRKEVKNKPILAGVVRSARITSDWHWHYAEAHASKNAEVSFEVQAGMTFGLLYEGELQLEINGCPHSLKAEAPLAFCFSNAAPLRLRRRFKARARVHKFTLGTTGAWLTCMGLETLMCQGQPQLQKFAATDEIVTAVNSLLALPNETSVQQKFQQMSNIATLLSAAGEELDKGVRCLLKHAHAPQAPETLEQRVQACVRDIVMRENIQLSDLQVDELAKSLGTSASSMQRIAKKCFGESLLKHIRQAKLANALNAMKERNFTIGEAAFLAGYKQASNFSLAFRKAYGFSPGEISKAEKDM
ncbi:AraC-type DNA-binding protein [Alteromonadaceae bacterium Bs31]|nr:AraC-type DNA-binding protein [Alteromonadaceae bacterium Bs31]